MKSILITIAVVTISCKQKPHALNSREFINSLVKQNIQIKYPDSCAECFAVSAADYLAKVKPLLKKQEMYHKISSVGTHDSVDNTCRICIINLSR